MHRILIAMLLAWPLFSDRALAESHCAALLDQGCVCSVPLASFPDNVVGSLSNISGDVMVTKETTYAATESVIPLNLGDGVVLQANAGALLSIGPQCSRQLPESSSLVIRAIEGCACADLVETQRQATKVNAGAVAAGLGLVGGGAALAVGLSNDDDNGDVGGPVSP